MPRFNPSSMPRTVADVLDDNATFEPAALAAARQLARAKPWRGSVTERLAKFNTAVTNLSAAYSLPPLAVVREGESDGPIAGRIDPQRRLIVYPADTEWLSVVTLLHLFSAVRGLNTFGRFRWSINLFRRCFPISYSRCVQVGPYLIKPERAAEVRASIAIHSSPRPDGQF